MKQLAVLAALMLFAVPAAAQSPDALYVTHEVVSAQEAPDCQTMPYYGLTGQAPEEGAAYAALSTPLLSCPWGFEYTVGEVFTLTEDMSVHLVFSCDAIAIGVGEEGVVSSIQFTALKNGGEIGSGRVASTIACAPSMDTVAIDAVIGGGGTAFEAGDVLTIELSVFAGPSPPDEIAGNLHVVVGGSNASHVILPGFAPSDSGAPAREVVVADLDDSGVSHSFTEPTSDTYHLNFTSDLVNSTAEFSWEAVNGSVDATILDASGAVVFEGAFEGNGTLSHEILGAAVGAWNLTLAYNDFNGKFSFDLAELARDDPEPEAPQSPDPVDNSTTEDNATAPVNSADQESPGLALVAVIGAIAIALRRRR